MPRLTKKMVEKALRKGAKSAQELHDELERSHLHGLQHSMDLLLD